MNVLVVGDNPDFLKRIIKIFKKKKKNLFVEFGYTIPKLKREYDALGLKNLKLIDFHDTDYKFNFDLILSAHCRQIIPSRIFQEIRTVNIHPGYNPYNRGWYPQVFAIIKNLPTGATIHEIDSSIDNGPIICREEVPIFETDTSFEVYNRILSKELELFSEYFDSILMNSYSKEDCKEEGFFFKKKDFEEMRKIDINKNQSIKETINLFRALSHGDNKNCYYLNENQERIYISIKLTKDN